MQDRILKRFDEMLALGTRVLQTRRSPSAGHLTSDFVDVQIASQWFTSSINLIVQTFGPNSEHYRAMQRQFIDHPKWPNASQGYGILQAARDDFANNALFDVKALIAAEVFDEFLEQA